MARSRRWPCCTFLTCCCPCWSKLVIDLQSAFCSWRPSMRVISISRFFCSSVSFVWSVKEDLSSSDEASSVIFGSAARIWFSAQSISLMCEKYSSTGSCRVVCSCRGFDCRVPVLADLVLLAVLISNKISPIRCTLDNVYCPLSDTSKTGGSFVHKQAKGFSSPGKGLLFGCCVPDERPWQIRQPNNCLRLRRIATFFPL